MFADQDTKAGEADGVRCVALTQGILKGTGCWPVTFLLDYAALKMGDVPWILLPALQIKGGLVWLQWNSTILSVPQQNIRSIFLIIDVETKLHSVFLNLSVIRSA